ncbi:hypothetical protein [Desertibacillus haloalkaliphilus]|uniref:hypothetical protein n=1 Tax=Desertibacillus haloalkaliphilus TaxID=1328930 RepID=UPI001C26E6DC|nr:hypothetical protein [Desertibacillus haloalkaliphilus]MBU8908275.1 hypothetical protein [Desertibacillus haloalkaliphilus]
MKYLYRYGFLIFTIILTIVGFSKLINSVENGRDSANEYLRTSMGGSMDSDEFRIIIDGYILSNITLGGILFFVGLTFFCVSAYKLSKKFNEIS